MPTTLLLEDALENVICKVEDSLWSQYEYVIYLIFHIQITICDMFRTKPLHKKVKYLFKPNMYDINSTIYIPN